SSASGAATFSIVSIISPPSALARVLHPSIPRAVSRHSVATYPAPARGPSRGPTGSRSSTNTDDLRVMQMDVGQRLERGVVRSGVTDPLEVRLDVGGFRQQGARGGHTHRLT